MTRASAEGGTAGTVVGFVGLGNMGLPMAGRLVAAGYHVRGFDISARARADFAALAGRGRRRAASPSRTR